jgi:hypothetical protein
VLTTLGVPQLMTVGSGFSVSGTVLTTLSVPQLTTAGSGHFRVENNATLTNLSLPVLTTVGGPPNGGNFYVTANSMLPTCQAQAVRNQLVSVTGSTQISGNLGTCP